MRHSDSYVHVNRRPELSNRFDRPSSYLEDSRNGVRRNDDLQRSRSQRPGESLCPFSQDGRTCPSIIEEECNKFRKDGLYRSNSRRSDLSHCNSLRSERSKEESTRSWFLEESCTRREKQKLHRSNSRKSETSGSSHRRVNDSCYTTVREESVDSFQTIHTLDTIPLFENQMSSQKNPSVPMHIKPKSVRWNRKKVAPIDQYSLTTELSPTGIKARRPEKLYDILAAQEREKKSVKLPREIKAYRKKWTTIAAVGGALGGGLAFGPVGLLVGAAVAGEATNSACKKFQYKSRCRM